MIEEIELKQTDKVIESVGVYMAHATALRYISKLKKEHDRVQHLLAECRGDVGQNERFICADQKKITMLGAELKVCQEENSSLLSANGELATRQSEVDKLDAMKDAALMAAKQCLAEAAARDKAMVCTIEEQWAVIEEQDRVIGLRRKEVRALKIKNNEVLCKLNTATQAIEGLEAELLICRGDSRTLMKVVELFKEFGTMSGRVATRDLRCIRDLLETYLTVPAIPETPINKTIANAKLIMADAISLMEAKNADYGDSWRMMRTPSITDQILVKVHRIRSIEESPDAPKVSEGIESEYRDILNYCVFAMIQLQERIKDQETKASSDSGEKSDRDKISCEMCIRPPMFQCGFIPWDGSK